MTNKHHDDYSGSDLLDKEACVGKEDQEKVVFHVELNDFVHRSHVFTVLWKSDQLVFLLISHGWER